MSENAKRRLPTIPLLARVILALAAVGILPLLVSVYQIERGREAVIEQVQQTHLVSAVASSERVAAYLELLRSLGRSTLEHPLLRSAPASEDALALLTGILHARSEVAAAGLFVDGADETLESRPLPQLVQLARRADDRQAVEAVIDDLDARPVATVSAADARWLRLRLQVPDSELFLLLVADLAPIESALRPEEIAITSSARPAISRRRWPVVGHRRRPAIFFALGIVLYQSLTGRRPFTGRTPKDVLIATATQRPRPVELVRPEVPAKLSRLVAWLLEPEPEARLADARAAADMLVAASGAPLAIRAPKGAVAEASIPPELRLEEVADGADC